MALPKLEVLRTARADRQKERAKLRELANAVHYIFLPGGSPPDGTLDITDRVTVNAPGSERRPNGKFVPQGRLVPLRSFFYPCPVLAHETTSRQIYETGVYEPDDEDCPSTVDTHQPAAAMAAEIFEAYGNPVFGIGLVIVNALTGIENVQEYIEPLLWPQQAKDLLHVIEMLEGADARIEKALAEKFMSRELAEVAEATLSECLSASLRCKRFAERECERAVNEVESSRAGHEGAKQLDPTARYWFKQLRVVAPRDEVFQNRVAAAVAPAIAVDPSLYKSCPLCGEDVKATAVFCKWCHNPIGAKAEEIVYAAQAAAIAKQEEEDAEPTSISGGSPVQVDTEIITPNVEVIVNPLPNELTYGRKFLETDDAVTRFDKKKK